MAAHKAAPSGHVDLDKHKKVICVGDVHGDFRALLRVLHHSEVADVPTVVLDLVEQCPTQRDDSRLRNPLSESQFASISWRKGCKTAIVFLGDVLDNRRGSGADPYGVCALAGTQTQMMLLLVKLHKQARKQGGKLIWVLGNHDVENAVSGTGNAWFCNNYAPRYHMDPTTGEAYATCDARGFSDTHAQHVRAALLATRSVAVVKIHSPKTKHSVVALHGGISRDSMRVFTAPESRGGPPAAYRLSTEHRPDENIRALNQLFHDVLHHGSRSAERFMHRNTEVLPTWCRPSHLEDPVKFQALFGTARQIKAHDVQETANCNGRKANKASHMSDIELCRIDVGMSRCFGHVRRRAFTFIELTTQGQRLMRQIKEFPVA